MAKVLGFDNDIRQKNRELESTLILQRSLIEELVKLNEGYEEEVKRLVTAYDALYEKLLKYEKEIQKINPNIAGYPTFEKIEYKDFSKTKTNE